jgi:hypothetical protein
LRLVFPLAVHGQCHAQPPRDISNHKAGLTLLRPDDPPSLITILNFQTVNRQQNIFNCGHVAHRRGRFSPQRTPSKFSGDPATPPAFWSEREPAATFGTAAGWKNNFLDSARVIA